MKFIKKLSKKIDEIQYVNLKAKQHVEKSGYFGGFKMLIEFKNWLVNL
ncbi:hypothetical protein UNSW2_69 [Campylobacter concisus UNSW2]|uniref:Uncharacterized protein n=1 Tax=Campylobacter concisus UNSW2 TaxID=1242965 RepID=U2FPP9_9BACT|nr:hypothetical protein UNSW2_69 [Campylobacter concisus UNSW2]